MLKPEGKAMLNQLVQALNGQMDNFELRVVSYTDSDAEASDHGDAPTKAFQRRKKKPPPSPSRYQARLTRTSWELTAARAATIARFLHDQTTLPFLNVLVIARGDSEPIVTNARKDDHARNRRVEITVTPLPVPCRRCGQARRQFRSCG